MGPTAGYLIFNQHPSIHPRRFDQRVYDYICRTPAEKNYPVSCLFKSRDICVTAFGQPSATKELMESPAELAARFTEEELEHVRRRLPSLFEPEPSISDVTGGGLALEVWELLARTARRYGFDTGTVEAGTKPSQNYTINLDAIRAAQSGEYRGYPPQAALILRELLAAGYGHFLEDELVSFMNQLVAMRRLKTTQDPWVVFQFYRPEFIEDGLILRGS